MALPRVLVVDDELSIAEFLKDFLEDNGFSVDLAHTGADGLRLAMETLPDIILLDVQLPDTDGYALCRHMRKKIALRNKPILMLTAYSDRQNELAGLRAGADDYLTKPVDTARLLARLNTALHRNIRELDANPLTHLPGNASISQELTRLIQAQAPFAVIYGDLNNFKAFNDRYGFLRGDQVIKLTAQCLLTAVEAKARAEASFIGHVGGDDFVMAVDLDRYEDVCRESLRLFDEKVPVMYDEEDRARGFIEGKTRQGHDVRLSLMGLALVVVRSTDRPFVHPGEIIALASEMKPYAKSFEKSAFVVDRRKAPTEKTQEDL